MVSLRTVVFGLVHLHGLSGAWAVSPSQIAKDLQRQLSHSSEVVLTSESVYTLDFTPRFAISSPPSYSVGVKPANIGDVQKVVQYASKNKVPFLATGGGHGYSWSLDRMRDGINLDMSDYQSVEIDKADNTVTVGGATRLHNVTSALQAAGRELPVGQCPTVGIGGYTLGGGVGPFSGIYGPIVDSLISVEMVTGTGKILAVSQKQYSELFYGIKGAGFNYGVVTSFKYRTYPATNGGKVMVANVMFPAAKASSVLAAAGSFVGHQQKELSINLSFGWNATVGGLVVVGSFYYAGPETRGKAVIKPFLDLKPLNVEITTTDYDSISSVALYGALEASAAKGVEYVPYSVNLYKVDVKSLMSVFNYMNTTMAANEHLRTVSIAWAQYSTFGFQTYETSSAAFPYRDVAVFLQVDCFGISTSQIAALNTFGRELRDMVQKGSGSSSLEVYVNFGHGDEGPESWYTKGKLRQLKALKSKYDPDNLFGYYNPI